MADNALRYVDGNYSDSYLYSMLRPYVAEWFRRTFKTFTPPQRMALPEIKAAHNVLISAPTGTGKTLAVFLGLIDELYRLGEAGRLKDQIYVVYVSPLRALNNDMKRNLLDPIEGIGRVALELGYKPAEIRVAVRTSDTTPNEKQKMSVKPPHILITTPESLAISLIAPRFREKLKTARCVVVDEIHELCSSKRGVHLSLSLERLENLTGRVLLRIGLSATISPLEEVAKYLVGYDDNGNPRPCSIVDARFTKPFDVRVIIPARDLIYTPPEIINESIYRALNEIVKRNRTVLVFTNTRSATERVVYKLRRMFESEGVFDVDDVEAHHSSLSRNIRLEVEEKLKKGELKAVVCSTSLELGIDIGYIDTVVLLSSPKSVSRLLQRVGRSGHRTHRVSRGRLIVVDRDDLIECTVLAEAAMERRIDNVKIPKNCLDVLVQHIVGMALESKWGVNDAYRVVRRSYNYHDLPYSDYMNVLKYVSGGYGKDLESRKVYGKIWLDEEEGVFGRRGRGKTRMIYYMNSGTIPDEAKISVYTLDRRYIGELDENFLQILSRGDIFVLGGRTYEFIDSYGTKALVKPAEGQRPTVPSWFSEMLPLAFDSALLVGAFRREVAEKILREQQEDVLKWLTGKYRLQIESAENIYNYVREQILFTHGLIPSDKLILVEVYDEETRRNIIFHTLFGRRANDALSRAYAYSLSKLISSNVKVTVTDNGFMLTIPKQAKFSISTLLNEVNDENIEELVRKAIRRTELVKRIFRHCAVRSFMILRRYMGYEKTINKLQLNAQAILSIVEDIEDFPVLKETYREILEDHMDIQAAKQVLKWVRKGEISIETIGPSRVPSPFAHIMVIHGYSDIVLMEDRRKLLETLHREVLQAITSTISRSEEFKDQ